MNNTDNITPDDDTSDLIHENKPLEPVEGAIDYKWDHTTQLWKPIFDNEQQ